MTFQYDSAFSRNLGLVTVAEQNILKSKKVAIAGVGGVGGLYAQTLARMGIEKFHLADMDVFELANFNRQVGARMNTIGQSKVEVIKQDILAINPEADVTVFNDGVTEENLDAFLDDVDLYADGLDFFVLDLRAKLFERCREKGIFAITAGPIGLSTALLVFDPQGMAFEEYFQLCGRSDLDKAVRFLVGLSPKLRHRHHIVDMTYVDLMAQKGPSLAPACMACAAVIGGEALKILLNRGTINAAPWVKQFDMYENRYHKTYNLMGNRNPINRLKIRIVRKMVNR
ncbi:ThiF family adenylyltransferase [Aestuariispira insulae]|uniref:ThiF family protein n=1 Tax=Aestuariispira insulae TaxID=1461337 RepID=A0A3D9HRW9_9PROT|nr:ThiF family adenylyltransferase [Aestuariispira insulae]RED52071.1 ThiF family protein [Aestuariispira insulae]